VLRGNLSRPSAGSPTLTPWTTPSVGTSTSKNHLLPISLFMKKSLLPDVLFFLESNRSQRNDIDFLSDYEGVTPRKR
jgi:hypothetical protein